MGTSGADVILKEVVDQLHEGFQVIGPDWRYLYVNATVAAQAQRLPEQLIGRTMMECFPGIDQSPMFSKLKAAMLDGEPGRMENPWTLDDGSQRIFELRFLPVPAGVCILSLDVTEVRRTAAELSRTLEQTRHLQKMEAVSRLAGGVAHDFNNLLSVILSYTSMMVEELSAGHPHLADLLEVKKAGERGAALTRQLLSFSHKQVFQPRVVAPNEVVASVDKMVARLLDKNIEVRHLLAADVSNVIADLGLLEQVLMNLVVNARDAMLGGGTLTIETRNVDLDDAYAAQHVGVSPGRYVMIAVSDTGVGMAPEVLARVFEPFFTTKDQGFGTGLGLATVFGIVKQIGGNVWVYSEPGRGSTFKVYLPRTAAQGEEATSSSARVIQGSGGTVLLVEDDEAVRSVAAHILTRDGFHVLQAANGPRALELLRGHGAVVLVLTDVVMRGMSGPELAEAVRALQPDVPIIYMSGYTEDAMGRHELLKPGTQILEKPLTPAALRDQVRAALGGPPRD